MKKLKNGDIPSNLILKQESNTPLKGKKILLIEGGTDNAELIVEILEEDSIEKEIVLIKDGQEVINYFLKAYFNGDGIQSQIYMVIADLNLPKVHGTDVLELLKGYPKYSSVPVVVRSKNFDGKTIAEACKNDADNFITKHISCEKFDKHIRVLKNYLKMKKFSFRVK